MVPASRFALLTYVAATVLLAGLPMAGYAAPNRPPSSEEMWQIVMEQRQLIQNQQTQIKRLNHKVDNLESKTERNLQAVEANKQAVAATADAVEETATKASAAASWAERTKIGGYGEVHYNNLNGKGGASDKKELDFHRFVLYFGHEFTDRIRFFSEVELEHAVSGGDEPGEVELEQAYLDFDLNDHVTARGGLFLLPVGILNQTHEPTTFYGVERNPVETNIIPTTWWEIGGGAHGSFAPGWGYDAYVHSGLDTSAADGYRPRPGRQKGAKAKADNLAGTAQIKWTGRPGVELAASLQYQDDITQGSDPTAGSAWLFSTHGIVNRGAFGFRALYGLWDLSGDGPRSIGADRQYGFYLEPSWKFTRKWGIFGRFNQWDNADGDNSRSRKRQYQAGLNWWPHENVVLKADYQYQDNEDDREQNGFNLGLGYQF